MADGENMCTTFEREDNGEDMEGNEVEMAGDEIEENEESSDDSSDEEESEIKELRQLIEDSPFNYDNHVKLINALREFGDLDRTRQAREAMSKIFPLTAEMWLEWTNDERPLGCIPKHKKYITKLFKKAVLDYQSVKLWTEYCQYIMDNMEGEEGIADARAVFERAIMSVGLHLTEGVSVWDGYREFEMALFDSYKQMAEGNETDEISKKLQQQREKVKSLFKREVSVPLIGIQAVYRDFEEWLGEDEDLPEGTENGFKKAELKIEECLPYEEALTSAAAPKLEEYRSYIAYETKENDPARVQCLYERALVENCLNAGFWAEYTTYMDTKLTIPNIVLPVHERAVRNCPWVVSLWCNYLKAMERTGQSHEKTKDLFDRALLAGFTDAQNFVTLWLCYLEYLRRRVEDWEQDSQEKVDLQEAFKNSAEYFEQYLDGQNADSQAQIARYRAQLEATKMNNLKEARQIWETIMPSHNREVEYWLEYVNLLRRCNDVVGCRKLFKKAIQINSDNPERLCDAWQKFEKEEGSLVDHDYAVEKCGAQLKKVLERRTKEYEAMESHKKDENETAMKRSRQKADKRANKKAELKSKPSTFKRKHQGNNEAKQDGDGHEPRQKRANVRKGKEPSTSKTNEDEEMKQPLPAKEMKDDSLTDEKAESSTNAAAPVHDKSHDHLTVFVSNIAFSVDEEQLESTFSPLGEITEVRLVKNHLGKSKGYAYVEFKNESSVAAALAIDRQELRGRPMYVSPCVDKKEHPTTFKLVKDNAQSTISGELQLRPKTPAPFQTSLDRCTVFVTNLSYGTRQSHIEDLFKEHGKVKEVRLVTNRSGKSKGFAYVEYEEESAASNAILKLDQTTMGDRQIFVALSNPPKRQQREPEGEMPRHDGRRKLQSAGYGRVHMGTPLDTSARGRARTQLQLLPRALQKSAAPPATSSTSTAPSGGETSKPKLSNDDFRKLLSK